ncbi:DinB family protein [Aquipuribacter nitratireducens]|uniref:DinB family protein n=1 Tax=Aquipuribacter nitratireducens TaxID=650104 RepID=A0ABW0GM49_9MICO
MTGPEDDDPKDTLQRYLQAGREAVLWKLDGLGEYDVRRPLTATGTNLLGLVKHLAGVEAGYFGLVFGRPFPDPPAWMLHDEPEADMWATAEEPREDLVALYRRVWAHSDSTVAALDLDAAGDVPWWGDRSGVTLHLVLVHVATETHRHAGHADVLREGVDGAAGLRPGNDNLGTSGADARAAHVSRVEAAARRAAGLSG